MPRAGWGEWKGRAWPAGPQRPLGPDMAENSGVGQAGDGRFCGAGSGNQHSEEKKSDGCSPKCSGFGWGRWEELDCCLYTESLLGVSILRLLRKGAGASPLVLQLELRSGALHQALPSPNSLMICLLVQIREPASGEM